MAIILASQSPRRRELLTMLGLDFTVIPASSESAPENTPPREIAIATACGKAREIAAVYPGDIVVAADTVVFTDGETLGKPRDAEQARSYLRRLSGRGHDVYTGLCVVRGAREVTHCEKTSVFFRELTDAEIARYVATGEPMDKAGAYGAQGIGALFIERIDGDFFNVMGLPVCALGRVLGEFGVVLP